MGTVLKTEPECRRRLSLVAFLGLGGTFAFALNGGLDAPRLADVDVIGVVAFGLVTVHRGGIVRDLLLGRSRRSCSRTGASSPKRAPVASSACGSTESGAWSRHWTRGPELFAVTGKIDAVAHGAGPGQPVILGAITGVGGGTIRDILPGRIPEVQTGGLYSLPAPQHSGALT